MTGVKSADNTKHALTNPPKWRRAG